MARNSFYAPTRDALRTMNAFDIQMLMLIQKRTKNANKLKNEWMNEWMLFIPNYAWPPVQTV